MDAGNVVMLCFLTCQLAFKLLLLYGIRFVRSFATEEGPLGGKLSCFIGTSLHVFHAQNPLSVPYPHVVMNLYFIGILFV